MKLFVCFFIKHLLWQVRLTVILNNLFLWIFFSKFYSSIIPKQITLESIYFCGWLLHFYFDSYVWHLYRKCHFEYFWEKFTVSSVFKRTMVEHVYLWLSIKFLFWQLYRKCHFKRSCLKLLHQTKVVCGSYTRSVNLNIILQMFTLLIVLEWKIDQNVVGCQFNFYFDIYIWQLKH